MVNVFQRKMAGHGILMILCTLLFGVGLWVNLVGGFELFPGIFLKLIYPAHLIVGLERMLGQHLME